MFPNNKTLSYPLYMIGVIMIFCGIRWLIHPEPWMLDEVANVERLGMRFDALFAEVGHQPELVYLQPISQKAKATRLAIDVCKEKNWRLSVQVHKYIGIA
mgnify:CR=1 FL=1